MAFFGEDMADILVIEDDQRIRELVCNHLAGDGHSVNSEGTGLEGLRTLTADPPDALVLDLGLPDLDGLDLLKMIRAVSELPILVLTAREDESSILTAFAGGADDYVVKPISGPQLSARISALLRRGAEDRAEALAVGGLMIRLGPREVELDGRSLELTAKEFDLLAYLAARPGTVVSKDDLHAAVWKAPAGTGGRTIDVHLSTLRKKLGEKPTDEHRYLHTLIGAGVCLSDPNVRKAG
jgi:DNA-binding response OmpR family regulator